MSLNFQNPLRFNKTSEQIIKETEDLLKEWGQKINQVALNEKQTYENTIYPFQSMDSELGTQINNLGFFSSVASEKEVRDASVKSAEQFDQFFIELDMREDIYNALQKYVDTAPQYHTKEQQRYVEHLLRDYKRNGLDKSPEVRQQIKALQKQIADLERQANQNMNEDVTRTSFKVEELEGLPQSIIDQFEDVEDQKGYKWVSLKYPDVLPTMRFAKQEATRQKMDFVYQNKCASNNTVLLEQLVDKRHQLALLLGYTSISDYILEIRMAKNSLNVQQFEQRLIDKLMPAGKKELAALIALKSEHTKQQHTEIQSWDYSYFNNLMKETQFKVNEEELKEYFPTQHVIKETFSIYQELLGVSFKQEHNAHTWHPEVQCFTVYDNQYENQIGQFYLDLYPRDGKYGHAAAFPLVKRAILNNQLILPVAAMVCNFQKPTQPGKDSLMNFDEVETFFHEFGHIMHNICSEATFARFSGTSVERDFVELPSQMLENWCWDKTILKRLSKHHSTQQELPDELIDKKIKVKNLNNALFTLRQIQLGVFDHLLHTANDSTLLGLEPSGSAIDIIQMRQQIAKQGQQIDTAQLIALTKENIALIKHHPNTNFAANFGHMMGGYQAQYYGYLWSQVYSCDLFAQFQQQGIMDKQLGIKYRKLILAPGGSRDSMELIREFLGREPNEQAFLEQNGFV